jgi:hypothetical protein
VNGDAIWLKPTMGPPKILVVAVVSVLAGAGAATGFAWRYWRPE